MDAKVIEDLTTKYNQAILRYGQTITVGGTNYQAIINYKRNNVDFDDLEIKTSAALNRGTIVTFSGSTYIVISEVNTKRYGIYYDVVLRKMGFTVTIGGSNYPAIIRYKKNNMDYDDLQVLTTGTVTRGTVITYESHTFIVISEVTTKRYGVYYEVVIRRMSSTITVNSTSYPAIIDYRKDPTDFDDLLITTTAVVTRGTYITYEGNTYVVLSEVNTKRYGAYYEVVARRLSFEMMVYIVSYNKNGSTILSPTLLGKFYIPCFISTSSVDESGKYYFALDKIVVVTNEDQRIVDMSLYEDLWTQYTIYTYWFFEGMGHEWVTLTTDLSKPGLRLIHCTQDTTEWDKATKAAAPFI